MDIPELGQLTTTNDGRCRLTFERRSRRSKEKVWRAITEAEHLRGWFAQYLDYDRSQLDFSADGAELVFHPAPGSNEIPVEVGQVISCVPPSLLEYTWGTEVLRWELAEAEDGGCRLTFDNIFDDPSFAPFNAFGWHVGLDRLAAVLGGDDPAGIRLETDTPAAGDLQAQYERSFG
ncbi:SRPBCC domain-containing protein [Actinoalloteichus hymeniacidonis]|uniref:Activator of Hsp90 ATPase homologue 1/2-like C-terminal domain-containing protein n=1 Tax=Actinoalloteichus hymeniacidonis TaxID=340345 RepID=A0AAC9MZ51_9PSEU|nr:SRPBCC domain-containing protein [Actinoalloteichus hymeniacidonis]AOS64109.1 hypothetical protein TL08_16545 [Actinoalloteichus hymeniacidonis]MBB5907827.1 uncharacterized protein YndB with AHSA1/START domain [Actinoalloteichus hymeniacidonis]